MSVQTTTYDVFLSHSLTESAAADLIERALVEAGLDVFSPTKREAGEPIGDALWQALAESAALVVVLHPQQPPASSVLVELGAAMAWHKPVYVVQTAEGNTGLPGYLRGFPVYPIARIDDVAGAIKRSLRTLSEDEQETLRATYSDLGIPADSLLRHPSALDRLAREFNSRASTNFSGEQLVREILRLRKAGGLPRLRRRHSGGATA